MSADSEFDEPVQAMSKQALAGEVQSLREELRNLREDVHQLQSTVDRQATELEELRGDLQQERRDRKQAEEELKKHRTQQIARAKADVREDLGDDIDDLHETVVAEQQTRSRSDARLKQRIGEVADAAGVEIDEESLVASDHLVRLVRNGPSDVTDRVYPVHERAQALLEHAEEWGEVVSDANGYRAIYTAPKVRPYLNAYFDRQFKSSEIKRIFEKIAGLAETSPRAVRKTKTQQGEHVLTVELVDGGLVER